MSSHMTTKSIYMWKHFLTVGNIDMASLQYEFSYDCQDKINMKILSHIVCIDIASSQYEFSYAYRYSL